MLRPSVFCNASTRLASFTAGPITVKSSRDGAPIWIDGGEAEVLERVSLRDTSEAGYNEAWLQNLLYEHPALFPASWIEPEFDPLISGCREMGVTFGDSRSGSLDNVFVTAAGRIVLVEAKLWRNPQARREGT